MLYFLIGVALLFNFQNGYNDSSTLVATVISSRALRPRAALIMSAAAELAAPFIFGVAVANSIGRSLIEPSAARLEVVVAATLAAMAWSLFTWFMAIPASSSHALVGGLLGAALTAGGLDMVHLDGVLKILLALFISPPLGLIVGFIFMHLNLVLFQNATPRINIAFRRLQIFTSLALALSHGSNDAQKTMGLITLGLVAAGYQDQFQVPLWVVAACAGSIALGISFGGWRLIHTLGGRIYKIRPVHAFSSQAASAAVILGMGLLGGPVSSTQVVSSAIMGAGAAERIKKVRWNVAQEMLITWLVTIPVTALVAAGFMHLLAAFMD